MTRYQVADAVVSGASVFWLRDTVRQAEACIVPEYGANATAFRTTPDDDPAPGEPVDLLVPPENPAQLRDNPFASGNPILFPFPNRVRQGIYTFEGRTYRMDRLMALGRDPAAGHAIHGLVADKPWSVEAVQADADRAFLRCTLTLDAYPDIQEQYPFPCRLTATYTLCDGVLELQVEATNTGPTRLPMGFGIHPWFPVALRPGRRLPDSLTDLAPGQRARTMVRVPCTALWELDQLMPTGRVLPAEGPFALNDFRTLEDHFYDHVFTEVQRNSDGWSEASVRDPQTGMEAYLSADPAFREWVFYAPLDRPVVALEPYTCPTDAVNLQARGIDAGLIALSPGGTWRGTVRFGLRRF
ncbi:MAG: hypothetical protein RMJ43_05820 [Chloroherpetonaceae bacterium]|nr:hypothetical protein [Chthonomonadaceae bacterium]MDW8207334.1 hypothetical protein [Chloroherpetonaceae bacterium]